MRSRLRHPSAFTQRCRAPVTRRNPPSLRLPSPFFLQKPMHWPYVAQPTLRSSFASPLRLLDSRIVYRFASLAVSLRRSFFSFRSFFLSRIEKSFALSLNVSLLVSRMRRVRDSSSQTRSSFLFFVLFCFV